LHGKGKVAIIEGDVGNNNAKNIAKGNKDGLKKYPGIEIVADQASPMWARDKAMNIAENILSSHNDNIDAFIVANDDMAGGVSQALQAKGLRNIIVVGGDGDRDAMQRILAGTQSGTVLQSFIELPRKALQVAVGLARKEIDPSSFKKEPIFFDPVGSPVPIVTEPYVFISKKNIDVLQKYWQDCDALLK
jgi:ABC-type sugar transport system substrate-binding protein